MKTPAFWAQGGVASVMLAPLGALYDFGGRLRRRLAQPLRLDIPVLCIGNLVAGGAGKTPVALSVGAMLQQRGRSVAFLTRGHGGRLAGPLLVDPARHGAADVGDEALILAAAAPTWIARDRARGGAEAARHGAEIIVMDDGFQNPALAKTCSLVVIDGAYGFGNRRVIPAGPLREPVSAGLARADAVVLIGPDLTGATSSLPPHLPMLRAALRPYAAGDLDPGTPVFGFAGIGRPQKFRDSLAALGLEVAGFAAYPDHYRYRDRELDALIDRATAVGAVPVTTAKDHVRLPARFRDAVRRLDVTVGWCDGTGVTQLLDACLNDATD